MKAELRWYVAQVMTGSEQETARKLTDAGMEALAPVQILHERRHGKWWPTRRVVFPSYVFVRTGMTPRFYYFISGLRRFLCSRCRRLFFFTHCLHPSYLSSW